MPERDGIQKLQFSINANGRSNGFRITEGLTLTPPMDTFGPIMGGNGGAPSYVRSIELMNNSGSR